MNDGVQKILKKWHVLVDKNSKFDKVGVVPGPKKKICHAFCTVKNLEVLE